MVDYSISPSIGSHESNRLCVREYYFCKFINYLIINSNTRHLRINKYKWSNWYIRCTTWRSSFFWWKESCDSRRILYWRGWTFSFSRFLIILSAIYESGVDRIYEKANDLNLTTIVEVHNEAEAKKALKYKEAIIGINNRDLTTLKTDISTTYKLYEILGNHKQPLICESGIKSEKEVEEIVKKTGINNFLIGESLLKDLDKKSSLLKKITQIRA